MKKPENKNSNPRSMQELKQSLEKFKPLDGHAMPSTRREFLAQGLLGFSGMMMMPSLAHLLLSSDSAHAASDLNCVAPSGGLYPVIILNLAGGAMLSANFVPQDKSGAFLQTYRKMGLGDGANLPIETDFGNVPFAGMNNGRLVSQFLQGVRNEANATVRNNTAFVGYCAVTGDDRSSNPICPTGMMAKAGLVGSDLPFLGTRNTITGIRQVSPVAPPVPLIASSFNDVAVALGVTGALGSLSLSHKEKLMKTIKGLSQSQSRRLAQFSGGENLKALVECALDKNIQQVGSGTDNIDPRSNSAMSTIWNLNNAGDRSQDLVFSTLVFNALQGQAGAVTLEMGGYDYHNGTRSRGDQKDLEAGEVIGKILSSCNALNRSAFIVVMTDGACVSANSADLNAPWRSDRGDASSMYMMAYNPNGRPETLNHQLGYFSSRPGAEVVDESFRWSNTSEISAALTINWLALSGQRSLIPIATGVREADAESAIMFI